MLSYCDFKNAWCTAGIGLSDVDGKAAFNGLMQIAKEFFHGVALGRTAWNGWNFVPEAALLRIVHNDFDLHVGFSESSPSFRTRMNDGAGVIACHLEGDSVAYEFALTEASKFCED
jgi:hypothetical protein